MVKVIRKIIKKIIFSLIFLFSFNIVTKKFNVIIPINAYTVGIISVFDTPGIIGIILFYFINFR